MESLMLIYIWELYIKKKRKSLEGNSIKYGLDEWTYEYSKLHLIENKNFIWIKFE